MTSRSEPPTIREPRYAQIARDLAADIAAQRWAVATMPAEPALATSFQVSRETLRNALRQTEAWGLVTRRKGDGTRVVRRTPTTRFDTSLGTLERLVQFGRDAVREVCGTDQIEVDCELARLTGLPAGASLTRLTTIRRTTDGAAVAWTQIYLDPGDAAAVADDLSGRSSRLVSDLADHRTNGPVDSSSHANGARNTAANRRRRSPRIGDRQPRPGIRASLLRRARAPVRDGCRRAPRGQLQLQHNSRSIRAAVSAATSAP